MGLHHLLYYESTYTIPNFTHIDITDIHHYSGWLGSDGLTSGYDIKYNIAHTALTEFPNKPFHFGEVGVWGGCRAVTVAQGTYTRHDISTYLYYNNHDISLHNDMWGTALMGGFTAGLDWFHWVTHKWKYGQNKPPLQIHYPTVTYPRLKGDSFDLYDYDPSELDREAASLENFSKQRQV